MPNGRHLELERSFEGDENDLLRRVQEELFDVLCWEIFSTCRSTYLRAEEVLGVRTELGKALQTHAMDNHDLLGLVYRAVAADMRKTRPDLMQPELPFRGEDYLETVRTEWISYYHAQVKDLAQRPLFARAVVTAACWPDQPLGVAALELVDGALTVFYSHPGWDELEVLELLEPRRV